MFSHTQAAQIPSVSFSPPGDIQEGTDVTLTCTSKSHLPVLSYNWYKAEGSSQLYQRTGQTYAIKDIKPEHRGNYTYQPRKTLVELDPSGEITEGSRVTLTCSTDANPPAHTYSWYKTGRPAPLSNGESLTFSKIRYDDRYVCSIYFLDHPRNTVVEIDPPGQRAEGSRVTLTCSTDANPPAHTYSWYRRGEQTQVGHRQKLVFSQIRSEDSGGYSCQAANDNGQQDSSAAFIQVDIQDIDNLQSSGGAEGDVQYSTIQPKHLRQTTRVQGDDVQYPSVHFKRTRASQSSPAQTEVDLSPMDSYMQPMVDPSVVYSTVQPRSV
ncbi:hypothetical protein ACEWY4_017322 [Coilia grayii]|uniref:Ig-like domain-containing protein n=1 Tax=Coilia grayii TaxID=363190 RepID=A0ABD1JGJ3_9TELE